MLKVSPKGTVPVLILNDRTIEESMEVIDWALNQKNVFEGNLKENQIKISDELIIRFDDKFKYHLDRYKYSSRYGVERKEHQKECKTILKNLETMINPNPWIFGRKVSLLDISILPFIRQCKIANPDWFFAQKFVKVIGLLNYFENENLFIQAMQKYDLWDPKKNNGNIFP